MKRPGVATTICVGRSSFLTCRSILSPPREHFDKYFSGKFRVAEQLLADLLRELTRRRDDHRLDLLKARVDLGQQRQAKGRSLTSASLCLGDEIAAVLPSERESLAPESESAQGYRVLRSLD